MLCLCMSIVPLGLPPWKTISFIITQFLVGLHLILRIFKQKFNSQELSPTSVSFIIIIMIQLIFVMLIPASNEACMVFHYEHSLTSTQKCNGNLGLSQVATYWNIGIFIDRTLSVYHCECALNIYIIGCTIFTIFILFIALWTLSYNNDNHAVTCSGPQARN